MRARGILALAAILAFATPAWSDALGQRPSDEASCRVVEEAARDYQLPVAVLTRLIWYESRFRFGAVSPVGAQGVAQFMPATASERGLSDPFDFEQAIPHAASFLADLERHFGNIGLAIAAYNAGPSRVTGWLDKTGSLPRETSLFVLAVTGQTPEQWSASGPYLRLRFASEPQTCIALRAILSTVRLSDLDPRRGHMVPGMEQSGRVLSGLQQSGRPLPDMQQSGRLLPSLKQSGRTLP